MSRITQPSTRFLKAERAGRSKSHSWAGSRSSGARLEGVGSSGRRGEGQQRDQWESRAQRGVRLAELAGPAGERPPRLNILSATPLPPTPMRLLTLSVALILARSNR